MIQGRYIDGRTALVHAAEVELGQEALTIDAAGARHSWAYSELRRADDGNGRIILRQRKQDTGERLTLEMDAAGALRLAAPHLFTARAQGVEHPGVVGGVMAGAWSLAALFLVGVPFAADPIARYMPAQYREQIGDVAWAQVNAISEICDDSDEAEAILNGVAYRMIEASGVPQRDEIWISIVDAPMPNAFALPDNSIIVTDDLIAMAEHPDEVTGVIAHEIAHIEENHVMQGIVRQIGAGIFFDVVFGGAGAGQALALASMNLSGLRYTRDDEAEADGRGLAYLDASGINPGPFADLFDRLSEMMEERERGEFPTILSSHPANRERAAAARARARPDLPPSMNEREWTIVRQACGGGASENAGEGEPPAEEAPPGPPPGPNNAPPEAVPTPQPGRAAPESVP
jgi:Zn-dependent protease with chaperone function